MQSIDNFTRFYEQYDLSDLQRLDHVYAPGAMFTDPIQSVQGLDHIKEHLRKTSQGLKACTFEMSTPVFAGGSAHIEWLMRYAHSKLKGGDLLTLHGCSILTLDTASGLIGRHRDYYDMGEMLYENLPILGSVTKSLKNRLVK